MLRRTYFVLIPVVIWGLACTASRGAKEITDPEEAKADPDFSIQGEYVGDLFDEGKIGAQVIAQGQGKFEVVLYKGGLPGDGWKRGEPSVKMQGTATELKGRWPDSDKELVGKIADGKLTLKKQGDDKSVVLTRTERKSPTLGAKPPEGALVIFDGKNLEMFEGDVSSHLTEDGLLSGVTTKAVPDNCKLHLEFRLSWMPEARGQGRSNSGVYPHDAYEIQVLDSFGLEGRNNECGGFYSIKEPDVNMCLPPLVWQTYDIDLTAPKYDGQKKVANARMTIRHNGVVIHNDWELPRGTPGRKPEGPGPRGVHLQGHGNKVMYRNIWLVEKK
jgi:hypothetical protein